MQFGAGALSDAELVSLLAGVGGARAQALLEGGLRGLLMAHPETLIERWGLSAGVTARLTAAAELSRRLTASTETRPRLATPDSIYAWVRPRLCGLRHEAFLVLCLNSRNVLLHEALVARGSVDQCQVDPREALAPAVACRATGVVLVHNHPSGDPEPSVNDVALTRQLRQGARLLCIRVLDHLVVGEAGYVSLLTRGLLSERDEAFFERAGAR